MEINQIISHPNKIHKILENLAKFTFINEQKKWQSQINEIWTQNLTMKIYEIQSQNLTRFKSQKFEIRP